MHLTSNIMITDYLKTGDELRQSNQPYNQPAGLTLNK